MMIGFVLFGVVFGLVAAASVALAGASIWMALAVYSLTGSGLVLAMLASVMARDHLQIESQSALRKTASGAHRQTSR